MIENGDDDVKSKASPDNGNQVDSSGPRLSCQTLPVTLDVENPVIEKAASATQLDSQNESEDEESFYQTFLSRGGAGQPKNCHHLNPVRWVSSVFLSLDPFQFLNLTN